MKVLGLWGSGFARCSRICFLSEGLEALFACSLVPPSPLLGLDFGHDPLELGVRESRYPIFETHVPCTPRPGGLPYQVAFAA